MDLISCQNCLAVYGDVQDACPTCGADADGDGADVVFDRTTRAAIAGLGGLYGGILEGPGGARLLWCGRGVCLVEEQRGLVWHTRAPARVDELRLDGNLVRMDSAGRELVLDVEDGAPL